MWAGKLVVNIPVENVSLGTELSKTDSHGTFLNEEQLVPSTETDIHERNVAGFCNMDCPSASGTLVLVCVTRIIRNYFSGGVKTG